MADTKNKLNDRGYGRQEYAPDPNRPVLKTVAQILADKNLGTVQDNVNRTARASSIGSIDTAIGDNFFGINHRQISTPIQINKDVHGLTFFTRPELNFSTDNLRNVRHLVPLLTSDQNTYQRIIRCYLDPSLQQSQNIGTPLVDPQSAFIPLLSNNLLSMSGWPDIALPTYQSPSGVYEESIAMVDGVSDIYSTYNITANFRNLPGDPITALFFYWCHYASLVFQGVINPYPNHIIEHTMDYVTCIYRLVLDPTKTLVQGIAATGASFPENDPIGAKFNFDYERPYNSSNDQITISFKCMGARYQDDILIWCFNQTVCRYNDTMADGKRESSYKRIPIEALILFNNRGYPRINPKTYELEWWIGQQEWDTLFPEVKDKIRDGTFKGLNSI